ncbi:MAG TPA: hypothetical protein VIE65_12435 [Methylobacter sp.]|jgi:hypothetical protein
MEKNTAAVLEAITNAITSEEVYDLLCEKCSEQLETFRKEDG